MVDMFEVQNWIKGFDLNELKSAVCLNRKAFNKLSEFHDLWTQHDAFIDQQELFHERLKQDGLTIEMLQILQSEDKEVDNEKLDTSWINEVNQAFDYEPEEKLLGMGLEDIRLLHSVKFLIDWKIQQTLLKCSVFAEHRRLVRLFVPMVIKRLALLVNRAVVLELHIDKFNRSLQGETSEERFDDFIAQFVDKSKQLAFVQEYPVLARKVLQIMEQWCYFVFEFLTRLQKDSPTLQHCYPNKNISLSSLSEVNANAGDTHNGGRLVLILTFDGHFKLVYKPRELAAELHFYQLLNWLNQRNEQLFLKTIKITDMGTHGWCEFVEHKVCETLPELNNYYFKVGALLAVLYILEAKDIHFENIIAAGEDPVVIDLETLFQGAALNDSLEIENHYSVLNTGLLPSKTTYELFAGFDSSGLASNEEGTVERVNWHAPFTDEMRLEKMPQLMVQNNDNVPAKSLSKQHVMLLIDAISAGFCQYYQFLCSLKRSLLDGSGPIGSFAQDNIRYVLRNTHAYTDLLRDLSHPENLTSSFSAEHRLDYLYVQQCNHQHIHQIIYHERCALKAGDIPLFWISASGLDLQSLYSESIPDYLATSPLQSVVERINGLCQEDLIRQAHLIDMSLKTLAKRHQITRREFKQEHSYYPAFPQGISHLDEQVCEYLKLMHYGKRQGIGWHGVSLVNSTWVIGEQNNTLYEGNLGTVLFLAYFVASKQASHFRTLLDSALNELLRQYKNELEKISHETANISLFSGVSGYLYVFSHLYVLSKRSVFYAAAKDMKALLGRGIGSNEQHDIISGNAGVLLACLSAFIAFKDNDYLQLAVQCGNELVSKATIQESSCFWLAPGQLNPLSGFSHGNSGIIFALTKLYLHTKEDHFLNCVVKGMQYESSLFCSTAGDWADKREFVSKDNAYGRSFWCHGSAGILLSRLALLEVVDSNSEVGEQVKKDIHIATKTIIAQGFDFNHSLCHGSIGNLVILKKVLTAIPDSDFLPSDLNSQLAYQLTKLENSICSIDDIQCATPLAMLDPGFMLGLSGVGWGYQYLRSKSFMPCLLALEAPF